MLIKRRAKSTLTALEMHHGDTLEFTLLDEVNAVREFEQ